MSDGQKDPLAEVAEEEEERDIEEQLFGSDDEEDDQEQEHQAAAPSKEDRKAKLQELAARKEAEKRDAESGKSKRRRAALDDDEDEDEEVGGAGGEGAEEEVRAPRVDSEDDEEGEANAEDAGFIDDQGAELQEQLFGSDGDDDDDEEGGEAPQAEEAIEDGMMEDEFEALQQKGKEGRGKKRRGGEDEEGLQDTVEGFILRMEAAVEKDIAANDNRKPAIAKLKMCKEVSETLTQAHIQKLFLDAGGLTVLTHWLSPLGDGSLPSINIRSAILKVLLQMPIHVDDPERREQLKKSGLGKVVMFLYKLPEETRENRKVAKDLVERWSRPIFALDNKHHQPSEDFPQRNPEDVRARKVQKKKQQQQQAEEEEQELDEDGNPMTRKGPAPGERGWRWHASIPQASKLDYAVRPEPKFSKDDMSVKSDSKAKHDKLSKKMIGLKARNKRGSNVNRPAKLSVKDDGSCVSAGHQQQRMMMRTATVVEQ